MDTTVMPSVFHSDLEFTIFNWVKKFDCKNLDTSDIRNFWARNVPCIYSPKPDCDCLNITYDENAAQKILYDSLEQFITGTQDSLKFFEQLKTLDNPPTLCGRVFKIGEATYYCRDCGLDPTCVLCVDCFRNSVHKNHRYKMSMSGGGGYCDCGDEGAWKEHAFCDTHLQAKAQSTGATNPVNRIPQDVVERAKFVMSVVLNYCHEMLTWEQSMCLPSDLQYLDGGEKTDTYSTVLFNDEIHTYEQVIQTLTRSITCSQKEAVEFATTIDREGRSIVKCSSHIACKQISQNIERITSRHGSKPLRVMVTHTDIIAHQTFAMKLLAWLQQLLSHSEGFRIIFSEVMMLPEDTPLLESVMLNDTQLWKTARSQWHQLFISSMHMEQQCKKTFAKVFTKNYPVLMKDFIADDHEHSVSITSLSVQIFTMPLAHTLIREEDAMFILMRTFLTECERNRNEVGKLAFERNNFNSNFRRAHYVLYDLKYLLTVKPKQWDDAMRKNFLHGVQALLTLLSWMQGMDSVVRQTGQHVEFEVEWETGINLQLKLSSVITLSLEWCGTDKVVLIKALRAALRHMENLQGSMTLVTRELADHSASCIDYNVAGSEVTVHIPLSRFIAGLLIRLDRFNLTYSLSEFGITNLPSPQQLMELSLRSLVLVAQFRNSMWRRNGYSLLNQVFFYQNVRLRDEMFDKDILMLQIAASMIESNEFLIHVLNKYGLLNWAMESFDTTPRKAEEEVTRLTLGIAEECLTLLLTLVSERYTPGVGKVDEAGKIKKEITQLLCIEPMPHSQLFKQLPKDHNHETGMEQVINEVANFRKPPGASTGKYELKPEFFKEFNPFFYHYTREEQSKSEEVQVKRKRMSGEEECCPPPLPVEFCPNLTMVINLLQCDVMLQIMKLVLERTLNPQSSSFTENQFEKVLYLIGTALLEENRQIEKDGINTFFAFTDRASKKNILSDIEECLNCSRVDSQKDLIRWTIRKYKQVEALRKKGNDSHPMDVCEMTNLDKQFQDQKKDRKKNAEMAAARRAKIMAQMSAMQKNFIKEHADLFKEVEIEEPAPANSSEATPDPMEGSESGPIAIGNGQHGRVITNPVLSCILCREDQEVNIGGQALVLATFIQRSTVLSKNRDHKMTDPSNFEPLFISSDIFQGLHTSTCGHVMHSVCWQKFFDSVVAKERRRPLRYGRHVSFDVDRNEFLCPLCERLSNSVIPLMPPLSILDFPQPTLNVSLQDWLETLMKCLASENPHNITASALNDKLNLLQYVKPKSYLDTSLQIDPEVLEQMSKMFYRPVKSDLVFHESIRRMMEFYATNSYLVGLHYVFDSGCEIHPLVPWWTCIYTIQSMEWMLREQGKALFGELSTRNANCLQAIVRFSASSLAIYEQESVRSYCTRLLLQLTIAEANYLLDKCILELEPFSIVVILSLSAPNLFEVDRFVPALPQGNQLDVHIVELLLAFHSVQTLLSANFSDDSTQMDIDDEDQTSLPRFYSQLLQAAGQADRFIPSNNNLYQYLKTATLPFLRCCALYYHYLTDVRPPSEDLNTGKEEEFERLCSYLGITTTIDALLCTPVISKLSLMWAQHPRIKVLLSERRLLLEYPVKVNQLVDLPSDYSELINSVSLFTCPNSEGDDSRYPTMCLVCGEILCSQSYCCQKDLDGAMVGACCHHASICGSGVGIFLRIRDCKVLLLAGKTKGCYMAPPYVDDYGETDIGLVRGNPLHLCQSHYQELHKLWLSHGISEQIAHELEQSSSLTATNWQLL